MDSAGTIAVEVLNECTAGCTNPPNMSDVAGFYEIVLEQDSLAVYLNGSLLRTLPDNGIDSDSFILDFRSDNMYGSGDHSHIFIDYVSGLE